jgi:alpha-ketoglutarate-dependent taurine dioxygenase
LNPGGIDITPLSEKPFGAVVKNFDCADISDSVATLFRQYLYRDQLLVFQGQHHISPDQEVAFYKALNPDNGSIWRDQVNNPWERFKIEQGNAAGTFQIPSQPGVLVIGKGDIDHHGLKVTLGGDRGAYGDDSGSQVLGGGALQWHIDGTFYDQEPCHFTQMRCVEPPTGRGHWLDYGDGSGTRLWAEAGSTAFASGRVAYELSDVEVRARMSKMQVHYMKNPFQVTYGLGNSADGLKVVDPEQEKLYEMNAERPGSLIDDPLAKVHPLIWTCYYTGKKALMPHTRCMDHFADGDSNSHLGKSQSRNLAARWMRPAIGPDRVYVHNWKAGDLVIWNNRSMWHSATGKLARNDRRIQHLTAYNGTKAP